MDNKEAAARLLVIERMAFDIIAQVQLLTRDLLDTEEVEE